MVNSFIGKLTDLIQKNHSILCLGLDPDPVKLHLENSNSIKTSLVSWAGMLIEQTHEYICSIKPNIAFYEQFGLEGLEALKEIIENIPTDIPVIMDAKRGDIGNTAEAYARAMFEYWKIDAVTLNPYLGEDSIKPFLQYPGKMVFILCQTSNVSAHQIQNHGYPPLFEQIAASAQKWGNPDQVGFVVGATQVDALTNVRNLAPDSWLLAPGVGAQGGDLRKAIDAGMNMKNSGLIIPVSRSVIYAEEVQKAARDYRDQINLAISERSTEGLVDKTKTKLIEGLFSSGCVKFGHFTLASGKESPIYIDLRRIISFPELFRLCVNEYCKEMSSLHFDLISAVPYAALPLAAGIMQSINKPMIYPRKEAKAHGTGQMIEGSYKSGMTVVLIEDVITTGGSILSAIETLKSEKLFMNDVVVLVDRLQGGKSALSEIGCNLHSILNIEDIIGHLFSKNLIDNTVYRSLKEYIQQG